MQSSRSDLLLASSMACQAARERNPFVPTRMVPFGWSRERCKLLRCKIFVDVTTPLSPASSPAFLSLSTLPLRALWRAGSPSAAYDTLITGFRPPVSLHISQSPSSLWRSTFGRASPSLPSTTKYQASFQLARRLGRHRTSGAHTSLQSIALSAVPYSA